jgi:hypothetical protein
MFGCCMTDTRDGKGKGTQQLNDIDNDILIQNYSLFHYSLFKPLSPIVLHPLHEFLLSG